MENKLKVIWLEATGCSGNIISFLNANNPNVHQVLKDMVDLKFSNSLMVQCGEMAMKELFKVSNDEFVLIVEGAVATKDNGIYSILGRYGGRAYTALELVKFLGEKAKYVIAMGTCASYGGISAASPNPAQCKSVPDVLNREVIRLPLCPCHPDILTSVLYHLIHFGIPMMDNENRPVFIYGITIHDRCPRRSFFDKGIFAKNIGDIGCMFMLGCDGPVTKTDCPIRRWNHTENWPIGANTPCIGCGYMGFPDSTEPFIRCLYKGGEGEDE